MRILYNEYEAATEEAQEYERKIDTALTPLLREFLEAGHTTREFFEMVASVANNLTAETRLRRAMDLRRKGRASAESTIYARKKGA